MKDTFSIDNLPEAFYLAIGLRSIRFCVDMLYTNNREHGFKEMPVLRFLTREGGEFDTVVRHDSLRAQAMGQKELYTVKERLGDLSCSV